MKEREAEGSHHQSDRTGLGDLEQLESETRKMESRNQHRAYRPSGAEQLSEVR